MACMTVWARKYDSGGDLRFSVAKRGVASSRSISRFRACCTTLWGSFTRFASAACQVGDHRWVMQVVYLLARCLLHCLVVRGRREASKDAELLVLRHQNAVLRRQIGRVCYQPGDRLWLAALSRLIPGTAGERRSP